MPRGTENALMPCAFGSMCGRLQVGKENLHVAGLVGAAMCSASHDGISVKR